MQFMGFKRIKQLLKLICPKIDFAFTLSYRMGKGKI